MTRNSVHLLVEMLDGLYVPASTTPETLRGFENAHDSDAWRRHLEALTLVRNVEDLLTTLELQGVDVEIFRRPVRACWAAVGMAETPWGSRNSNGRGIMKSSEVDLLRALAMLVDARGFMVVDEHERRSLSDVLTEARGLVDEADLAVPVRAYLGALLDRATFLLANLDTYGPETLRSVALELGGAFAMQAQADENAGEPDRAQRWRANAYMMMAGFFGGSAGGVGQAIGEAAIKSIG